MPSLLHPLAITSMCLIPAAHAALPLDDPALAEDLKTYIASLDPTKPEDCIGFVNRHLSDILYTRFTHKSVLEDELARMKSTHATACLRNKTLKGKDEVHLTKLEFRLLCVLIAGRGRVLTHRQLLADVWGAAYVERPHYLRLYMARLRQKLESNPTEPLYFMTETGVGYRLKV